MTKRSTGFFFLFVLFCFFFKTVLEKGYLMKYLNTEKNLSFAVTLRISRETKLVTRAFPLQVGKSPHNEIAVKLGLNSKGPWR